MSKSPTTLEEARAAKETALHELEGVEGLNGIGLTRRGKGYALKVNFEHEPEVAIPSQIGGVDVVVEVVGRIHKLSRTSR